MKTNIKILVAIFILLICFGEIDAQDSNCEKLRSDEKTREGYFGIVEFREKQSFQMVRGTVELHGEPIDNVFVEIFADKNPIRVDGCKTGADGRFSFPDLKQGKYTIRLSKDGGFQITNIKIKVSAKSKNKKEIIGVLEIGV